MSLIPVTILTGFLGSGKTTLLKRILTEAHGQKIAVIENEFGEENIDNDILVNDVEENIIQMSNGCICCSIREDLRDTLQLLATKKRKGEFGEAVDVFVLLGGAMIIGAITFVTWRDAVDAAALQQDSE